MVKKKGIDLKIKIAIISGIVAIIVGYLGSPLADSQWKERPIADFSFGDRMGHHMRNCP